MAGRKEHHQCHGTGDLKWQRKNPHYRKFLSQSKIKKGQLPLEGRKVMSTEGSRGMP